MTLGTGLSLLTSCINAGFNHTSITYGPHYLDRYQRTAEALMNGGATEIFKERWRTVYTRTRRETLGDCILDRTVYLACIDSVGLDGKKHEIPVMFGAWNDTLDFKGNLLATFSVMDGIEPSENEEGSRPDGVLDWINYGPDEVLKERGVSKWAREKIRKDKSHGQWVLTTNQNQLFPEKRKYHGRVRTTSQ